MGHSPADTWAVFMPVRLGDFVSARKRPHGVKRLEATEPYVVGAKPEHSIAPVDLCRT
jgi:hypothetical protein